MDIPRISQSPSFLRASFTSKSPAREKDHTIHNYKARLNQLSKPKIRSRLEEEIVGPGRYEPKDYFLSTKCKSPSIAIGRSERFIKIRIPEYKESILKQSSKDNINLSSNNIPDVAASPSYSFNRTGHNLKLVGDQDIPGVGRYSPLLGDTNYKAFSFSKAKKNFNWKKGKFYIAKLGLIF